MLLDEDLQLIHALQIAPRASWAELANILESHPTTLAGRWERLTAAGIAWVGAHTIGARTNPLLAFIEVHCELAYKDAAVETFCKFAEIVSLDLSARDRTLLLTVSTDSFESVSERLIQDISTVPGVVSLDVFFATRLHFAGDGWRLNVLDRGQLASVQKLATRVENTNEPVPRIAPEVLHALARDGRRTASEIAREVGMSESTVRRQIRLGISRGVIRLRSEIAQDVTGNPLTVQWHGTLPAQLHDKAARVISTIPGLRLCVSTTGRTNFFIVMWLRSVADVLTVEQQLTAAVPELEIRESSVGLQIVKRVGWILGPGGRATGEVVAPRWGSDPVHP